MSITPSDIIQYLYCPRFTYFERVLRVPQNEEQYSTVLRGRELHNNRLKQNKRVLAQAHWRCGKVSSPISDKRASAGRSR